MANNSDNTVTVIDGLEFRTTTLNVGANPTAVAINPVTNLIYRRISSRKRRAMALSAAEARVQRLQRLDLAQLGVLHAVHLFHAPAAHTLDHAEVTAQYLTGMEFATRPAEAAQPLKLQKIAKSPSKLGKQAQNGPLHIGVAGAPFVYETSALGGGHPPELQRRSGWPVRNG